MDKEKKDKKTTPVHVVVQTVSGLEDELEMFIKDRVKGDAAGEIFVPKRQINVKKDGKWSVKTEIMFPGYVFIKTDDPETLYHGLRSMYDFPGGRKLLGDRDMHYAALDPKEDEFISKLGRRRKDHTFAISRIVIENGGKEYKPGDKVTVLEGDLKDYEAEIVKIDLHRRKAQLRTPFMGGALISVGIEVVE